ncbi:hypothetical protein OTU49_000069 [Cherax quadricarinatus]|uniref:protein-tyrosine-phosphatase n=1 Tax=Cherax quadricarinatus TaxID=27406 RepID=A0AAW0XSE7_CHEQU|nr:dual specificity protein phosphatase MPK-4-like isoform X2 [Cherax quadricarinatus]
MIDCEDDFLPDVDVDKIEDGLYLGNLSAAVETRVLMRYSISHILTVDSKPLPCSITSLPGMAFLYIQVNDMIHEDLLSHFEEAIKFIEDGQEKGNVLVHWLRLQRRCVCPNSGFMAQLLLFQTMGMTLHHTNLGFHLYRLHHAAASVVKSDQISLEEKYQDLVQPDPQLGSSDLVAYKCRSCRCALISQDCILPHCPGEAPSWSDSKWSRRRDNLPMCHQGIFTLPIAWMTDATRTLQGKLLCPKCHAKIGTYSWSAACRCPCDAKISPAFYFIPSKLDKCL